MTEEELEQLSKELKIIREERDTIAYLANEGDWYAVAHFIRPGIDLRIEYKTSEDRERIVEQLRAYCDLLINA